MPENIYLVLAMVVLLPIVPAYLLFKLLPKSDGWVGGVFQGMEFKFSGAFAGYLIVMWVVHGHLPPPEPPEPDFEIWTVEGEVAMDGNYQDVRLSVIPDFDLSPADGKFAFDLVRPKTGAKGTIWIDADDYEVGYIDVKTPHASDDRVIKVGKIELVPKYAGAAPYNETGFEPQQGGAG